jgi:hypothetical protein
MRARDRLRIGVAGACATFALSLPTATEAIETASQAFTAFAATF